MPTTVTHATQSGLELHEDKRVKEPVRAASTANVTLASPGTTLDGVTLNSGDRILLKNQSTTSQNGPYVWTGAATLLTRTSDADVAADFVYGFLVYVREGTANAGTYWTFTQSAAVTLETTAITFASFGAGSGTVTSVALTVPAEYAIAGSPVTSSGTLAITKANQSANTVMAGPTSGAAATPGFRSLAAADLPVMFASGIGHSAGAAPDPGAVGGAAKFLREDATWQIPAGGGGGGSSAGGAGSGALVPIARIGPLTAAAATMTFSSIPSTGFRNLRLILVGRSTTAAANTNGLLQFNGDTSTNYHYKSLNVGLTVGETTVYSATSIVFPGVPASTAPAGLFSNVNFHVVDYTGAHNKTGFGLTTSRTGTSGDGSQGIFNVHGEWANTPIVTTLTWSLAAGNFDVGSYAVLYGEMDTEGVLLTPTTNLLFETTLSASTASVDTGTLSQAYRDLRVEISGRGTNASTSVDLQVTANGDTGSNYNYTLSQLANGAVASGSEAAAATSMILARISAASASANDASGVSITIPSYTAATFYKEFRALGGVILANTANNFAATTAYGFHLNVAAITSLKFVLSAGNFDVGTTIRVYGEPAAAGGSSVGTGTRLRLSGNQSITTATATAITWDAEDVDADSQHYTSAANLTGTVSKTAASTTLTGSGTTFLTELAIGQVISVPGTAAEKRVVTAIASATSLTVSLAFVNTAAAQTATRVNSAVVFRQSGFYTLEAGIYSAAIASGAVTLAFYLNSLTTAASGTAIGQRDPTAVNASAGYKLEVVRQFQQWDFAEVVWTQNSGGSVNVLADDRTHLSISARPTVVVAIPYLKVEDQKVSGTQGGDFTSGAWQTRDLNTIVTDTASVAGVSSNQITLQAGTYRTEIRLPAAATNMHQGRLQNITATTTLLLGSNAYSNNGASYSATDSWVKGRFKLDAPSLIEVQHRCNATRTVDGYGLAGGWGTEVYTVAEFWKEG